MFYRKIFFYFILTLLSIFSTYLTVSIISNIIDKVLFFSAFLIAAIVALIFSVIWQWKSKNLFESFLIFVSMAVISINAISLSPVFVDRSLSVYVYLYSVENKTVPKNIYINNGYYENFVNRRVTDAEEMGFLKCDQDTCKPTIKAKIWYAILVPIAKSTNAFSNYEKFKKAISD